MVRVGIGIDVAVSKGSLVATVVRYACSLWLVIVVVVVEVVVMVVAVPVGAATVSAPRERSTAARNPA